jgi:probable phosphoglycerate mutase
LLLIRHGHSRATADQVVGGHTGCRGLTEEGRAQAARLRDRLLARGGLDADALLTSTLPRAIETADIVAGAVRAPVRLADEELCELVPGECDGMSWAEYRERHSFDMSCEPDRPLSPGGESLSTFHRRVEGAVRRLVREYAGRSIVIVTHGGFIVSSTQVLLGVTDYDHRRVFHLDPENTAMTEWSRSDDDDPWTLDRYNDAAHLEAR